MRPLFVLLGALLAISCGGSAPPATSATSASSAPPAPAGPPTSGGTSKLVVKGRDKTYEATGVALAYPFGGALVIQLVSNGSTPAPTCQNVKYIGLEMANGTLLTLMVGGFKGTEGELAVVGTGYTVSSGSEDKATGSVSDSGSMLVVTSATADAFDGNVKGGPASGELHVKLCPAPVD